ncbi:SMC-Scp complex subunit ScpB [Arsukibacterium indicum]|uniref:SMC-Scp complex subunit ScpB n=1 Tax=Arsukibacterium indicum TaxID=2848612 RepID=A0ABS6MIM5_9GAMM|nr:SMC-Scp complex subunit ScpB [Arsukibacterium indicum]MBV2128605.1 SMC-Scp complex subunit ScpB [Arsukibacterium indicum]
MAQKINDIQLLQLIEAAIFASEQPLSVAELQASVLQRFTVSKSRIDATIRQLQDDYSARGIVLQHTASGFRFVTRPELSDDLAQLWPERSARYSRAVLETLALIAYKQPITRGEIEEVRGVTVSTQIIRTLLDRGWVKVVGHKEVPGRPGLYATTALFLDYFGLKSLSDLPPLPEFTELTADLLPTVEMTGELH